jgi:hypothetical protein
MGVVVHVLGHVVVESGNARRLVIGGCDAGDEADWSAAGVAMTGS